MTRFFVVGEYDEHLIDAERVVSIQGSMEVERGSGNVRLYSKPGGKSHPRFVGSAIGLDNGTTIYADHSPAEVGRRVAEAITRQSVMPA